MEEAGATNEWIVIIKKYRAKPQAEDPGVLP